MSITILLCSDQFEIGRERVDRWCGYFEKQYGCGEQLLFDV